MQQNTRPDRGSNTSTVIILLCTALSLVIMVVLATLWLSGSDNSRVNTNEIGESGENPDENDRFSAFRRGFSESAAENPAELAEFDVKVYEIGRFTCIFGPAALATTEMEIRFGSRVTLLESDLQIIDGTPCAAYLLLADERPSAQSDEESTQNPGE